MPSLPFLVAAAAATVSGVSAAAGAAASHAPAACPDFDPSKIKLITFDCFAALNDTPDSLVTTVSTILPSLTPSQVDDFVGTMLETYGLFFGMAFDSGVQTPQPFPWTANVGLQQALTGAGLASTIQPGSPTYGALLASWSQLTPWPGTEATLAQLKAAGYRIATLSNGDLATLAAATAKLNMTDGPFGSDYPLGAFKPAAAIYNQVVEAAGGYAHVLHVAGSPIDAWGARRAGVFAALLAEPPMPGNTPCFLLPNITALPAVLGL